MKQMTSQAWWALDKQVRPEKVCRTTQEPVAAVLGKRCGVSCSLNAEARTAFREARQPSNSLSYQPQECQPLGDLAHRLKVGGA